MALVNKSPKLVFPAPTPTIPSPLRWRTRAVRRFGLREPRLSQGPELTWCRRWLSCLRLHALSARHRTGLLGRQRLICSAQNQLRCSSVMRTTPLFKPFSVAHADFAKCPKAIGEIAAVNRDRERFRKREWWPESESNQRHADFQNAVGSFYLYFSAY